MLLLVLIALAIAAWVSHKNLRRRVDLLEEQTRDQKHHIEALEKQLKDLRPTEAPAPAPAPKRGQETFPPPRETSPVPISAAHETSPVPVPAAPPKPAAAPAPAPKRGQETFLPPPETSPVPISAARETSPVPVLGPPVPPPPPQPPGVPFDWESLIGVKLFSAIAGIALVIAAIFFLRYSIDRGWLEPPVRVAIGVIVAVALLVVCELKAAREYPATANALDAAAIAILFATFFAAHALWHLIPATVAFGLLALVTAIAVALSIRRESIFIAVLGMIGGFATPALLSTGENRPIPLFAYLLLLNIGLAWVAFTKRWPLLSALSLVLTTLYQWGWVFKFLDASQLPLAFAIFLLFPLVSFIGLSLARPHPTGEDADAATFERTTLVSSALPLFFAVFLAAVPKYGPHAGLLFGFLLLVDAGLLAVGLARRNETLHAWSAAATLLVFAVWLNMSYHEEAYRTVLMLLLVFVPFFTFAPAIADRIDRPFTGIAQRAMFAAPLLLAAPAALAATGRAGIAPTTLFAVLFVLVALLSWRAIATTRGPIYFTTAFFAVAAQAIWSSRHLTSERVSYTIAVYAAFGLLSLAVPAIARRIGRPLRPPAGAGIVLLASLALLLFLAAGPMTPMALWGLALLIAIIDAGLFIEGAAARLPPLSMVGSLLSWLVLAVFWSRSAASVGLLPSLLVILLLTLVMLAGHAWSYARARRDLAHDPTAVDAFRSGVFLGLGGHLFALYVAANPAWSVPPWPLFAMLGVLTLAASVTALYTRVALLHAGSVVAAMIVVFAFAVSTGAAPWPAAAIGTGGAVVAFALAWMRLVRDRITAIAAGAALFLLELIAIVAAEQPGAPGLGMLVASHAITLAVLLLVTWHQRWAVVAPVAVVPAWMAVANWQAGHRDPASWQGILVFAGVLYGVFTAYPFVLGRRARDSRDPHFTALIAAAMFFFAARDAFTLGGFGWMMGAIPVFEGAVLAMLLWQLLRIQPAGARDLGRLALVAGAALAFVTVAIPLQLSHQWITIGWALEGAALAWLYGRIPHKGLLLSATALLGVVFVRLALNPAVFYYEPRGALRIFNWYLYAYLVCAAAMFAAAWFLAKTDDRLGIRDWRVMHLLSAAGAILLFIVLNIEIADYYATGPEIMFRFGATVGQDLTYTIGWLIFGMVMLAAGIYLKSHTARVAALGLLAVTTFKAFLYDLGSLGGLYRVGSLLGLAVSLTLVSLALQRFVLRPAKASKET